MLYIIRPTYFMCSYILQGIADLDGVCMVDYEKRRGSLKDKLLRLLRAYWVKRRGLWLRRVLSEPLVDTIGNVKPTDSVLFFGMENLKDLRIMEQELPGVKKHVFLWNTVSSRYPKGQPLRDFRSFVNHTTMEVSTFDPQDACDYGLQLLPQVYRCPDTQSVQSAPLQTASVFFIGKDKQRSKHLAYIAQLLRAAGCAIDFHILRDKITTEEPALAAFYVNEGLSYTDTLQHISQCCCILEVVQEGQTGPTLRSLEALFLDRKLMTTNSGIARCDFYHEHNILVLTGSTTADDIRRFLNSPLVPVPPTVKDRYDIRTWIKRFL